MEFRNKGIKIFSKYINTDKSRKIENKIFEKLSENYKDEELESMYCSYIYFYSSILKNKCKIDENLDIWDNEIYNEIKQLQKEKDEFISNPFVVEEGVMKCDKCGSNRTYSFSKQVRSADEGFTTFVTCANCNCKWRVN